MSQGKSSKKTVFWRITTLLRLIIQSSGAVTESVKQAADRYVAGNTECLPAEQSRGFTIRRELEYERLNVICGVLPCYDESGLC